MNTGYELPEFVTIFRSADPFALMTVKLTLNVEGIHCRMVVADPLGLGIPTDLVVDGEQEIEIQVPDRDVDQAVAVLMEPDLEEGP